MWQEIYKLPLRREHTMVFTADHSRAFDFPFDMIFPTGYRFEEDQMDEIVRKINGEDIKMCYPDLLYDSNDTTIFIQQDGEEKEFIIIRGWGNLTGPGGHNLPHQKAADIQDAFANYVLEKLSKI